MNWDSWRPEVEGWSSDILPFYKGIAAEFPDGSRIAEIGVYKGRSLLFLAEALLIAGKTTCVLYAVDNWKADWAPTMLQDFLRNLAGTPNSARRMIHARMSSSVAQTRFVDDASLDMVFIDADHNYESVKADIAAWLPKVKPGGIISGHDYSGDMYGSFPGVDQAVHEAFGKERVLKPSGSVWMVNL